jgi:hypothetical protein
MARPKPRFHTTVAAAVPHSRNGRHKSIVTDILADLAQLKPGHAVKVPLLELDDTKEKVRSALNRATRKAQLQVATASDAEFLYVWNKG